MDRIVFAHSQSLTHKTHTHTHSPVLTASNRPLHTHPHNSVTHWKQLTSIHWIVQKQPAAGACVCVGVWVFSSHLSLPLLVTRSALLLFKLVKPIIGLDRFAGPQGCNSSPKHLHVTFPATPCHRRHHRCFVQPACSLPPHFKAITPCWFSCHLGHVLEHVIYRAPARCQLTRDKLHNIPKGSFA